jgi:cytochrome c-type biogenesis protein CcmH/NrfG
VEASNFFHHLMTRPANIRSYAAGYLLVAPLALGLTAVTSFPQSSGRSQGASASFTSLSDQAAAALDLDKLDEAIPLFRKALALNPRWAEDWWSLGTAYYDQDRYTEAAIALQKVIALNPKHGTAHAMPGLCEFELGEDANALRDIEASKKLRNRYRPSTS